jgi:hypothetical protein
MKVSTKGQVTIAYPSTNNKEKPIKVFGQNTHFTSTDLTHKHATNINTTTATFKNDNTPVYETELSITTYNITVQKFKRGPFIIFILLRPLNISTYKIIQVLLTFIQFPDKLTNRILSG